VPIYLGADLPTSEIAFAAREAGARAVAVVAQALSAADLESQLIALRAALGPGVRVFVGGVTHGVQIDGADTLLLSSLDAFERELEILQLEAEAR
jgi:hypothetical protein